MTFPRAKAAGWTDRINVVTAAELEVIDQNQSDAIDAAAGGTYTPAGDINITDGAGGALGDIDVHGQLDFKSGTNPRATLLQDSLPNTNNQDIGISSGGQILLFTAAGAGRDHDMDNTGATAGDLMVIISTAAQVGNVVIHKDGSGYAGAAIVTFAAAAHCAALLYYDGADWRLGPFTPNATPGADA